MPQTAAVLLKIVRLLHDCDHSEQQRILRFLISDFGLEDPSKSQIGVHKVSTNGGQESTKEGQLDQEVVSSSSVSSEVRQLKQQQELEAREALKFLNLKTGKSFREVETNLRLIRNCLKSGATLAEVKGVIARKSRQWRGKEQELYLRPKTLFNATNFENYLGEKDAEPTHA